MADTAVPNPPRLTGDKAQDFLNIIQWLQEFYRTTVLERIATVAGSFTISGADNSAEITFQLNSAGQPQPDAAYFPILTPSAFTGIPPAEAFIVVAIQNQTKTGFQVVLYAPPGPGNSVTFNLFVARL